MNKDRLIDNLSIRKEMEDLLIQVSEEAVVLLKNENNILPIKNNQIVTVFGRCQIDYFYTGYGSGGIVNRPYTINLIQGLKQNNVRLNEEVLKIYEDFSSDENNIIKDELWGRWSQSLKEPEIKESIIENASKKSDIALIVVGRCAGEDQDLKLIKGSYYLTDDEELLIENVSKYFKNICLIFNTSNIIDMSFISKYNIGSIVYANEGGMCAGLSLANILIGKSSPSGKLSDTIAKSYELYPSSKNFNKTDFLNYEEDIYVGYRYFNTFKKDDILFPFGHGLSYTKFNKEFINCEVDGYKYKFLINVQNIGEYSGKDVIELYCKFPKSEIGNPESVLVAFEKTKNLMPNESEVVELTFDLKDFSLYDDSGVTSNFYSYVLLKGVYEFYLGSSSIDNELIYKFSYSDDKVLKMTKGLFLLDVDKTFNRMVNRNGNIDYEEVPTMNNDLYERILSNMSNGLPLNKYDGSKLIDVKNGRISLGYFISMLSLDELNHLAHGDGKMDSLLGVKSNAGAFGGVVESLRSKGIPPIITSDGPSGVRADLVSSQLTNATGVACTWNKDLVNQLGIEFGLEIKEREIDLILAPGMNIKRDPLCGRNFEYFSEDPYLSGIMAASLVKGIESTGVKSCPKHFLCNNQERARRFCDSRVSVRALREIYLRNFEYVIKYGNPSCIMTSYNLINHVYGHYNYDSCTEFLRKELGFKGLIITDWWMVNLESKEFKGLRANGYRVRSGINIVMPGNEERGTKEEIGDTLLETYGKENGITLSELQMNAAYILDFILNTDKLNEKDDIIL